MITEWILNIFYSLVSLLLTPVQLLFQPLGSMAGLVELLSYASIFIPIGTFVACLSVWLSYYVLRFVMTLINWAIAKVPTIE